MHCILQAWGEQGYDAFLKKLQRQYGEMAALAHSESEKQLAGLAVWQPVQAGMFMWYCLEGGSTRAAGWGLPVCNQHDCCGCARECRGMSHEPDAVQLGLMHRVRGARLACDALTQQR